MLWKCWDVNANVGKMLAKCWRNVGPVCPWLQSKHSPLNRSYPTTQPEKWVESRYSKKVDWWLCGMYVCGARRTEEREVEESWRKDHSQETPTRTTGREGREASCGCRCGGCRGGVVVVVVVVGVVCYYNLKGKYFSQREEDQDWLSESKKVYNWVQNKEGVGILENNERWRGGGSKCFIRFNPFPYGLRLHPIP